MKVINLNFLIALLILTQITTKTLTQLENTMHLGTFKGKATKHKSCITQCKSILDRDGFKNCDPLLATGNQREIKCSCQINTGGNTWVRYTFTIKKSAGSKDQC